MPTLGREEDCPVAQRCGIPAGIPCIIKGVAVITVPRLCIAALLCLCCAAAQAAPRPEQNARPRPIPKEVMALEEWMSFYYQSPTPRNL